jgi:hypothetical protein
MKPNKTSRMRRMAATGIIGLGLAAGAAAGLGATGAASPAQPSHAAIGLPIDNGQNAQGNQNGQGGLHYLSVRWQ